MKVVIVVLALIAGISAATMPDSEKAFLKQIHEDCQAKSETHVDENLLKHLSENTHNPAVMAHMMCMAQGTGMMTPSGILDTTVMKSKMSMVMDDQHAVDKMVSKCTTQKDSPMKTAMGMWMCFFQNNIGYFHEL